MLDSVSLYRLDKVVQIVKTPPQARRQFTAHRRLAGAHEPNQRDTSHTNARGLYRAAKVSALLRIEANFGVS